jgi:hypothetical protein
VEPIKLEIRSLFGLEVGNSGLGVGVSAQNQP